MTASGYFIVMADSERKHAKAAMATRSDRAKKGAVEVLRMRRWIDHIARHSYSIHIHIDVMNMHLPPRYAWRVVEKALRQAESHPWLRAAGSPHAFVGLHAPVASRWPRFLVHCFSNRLRKT